MPKAKVLTKILKEEKSCSEQLLCSWALQFAKSLKAGDVVLLEGELGAGKSTLAKYILNGLGYEDRVLEGSPTFAIAHDYGSLVHLDLYRIEDPLELHERGIYDYFWSEDTVNPPIVLCEWLSKFPDLFSRVAHISKMDVKRSIYVFKLCYTGEPQTRNVVLSRFN